jgi:predicted DCC family thiol-disulfide oxidoreductase YuxK
MKTSSKIIIYDDGCPMCQAYTAAFVATGILHKQGRKNFSNVDAAVLELIDRSKCNNEIPLLDTNSKEVWYGIDALLELLDSKIPFVKFIGNIKPVKWFLQKLYKFISYNRKVIVGSIAKPGYDSSPDFNIKYRVAFLLVFFMLNTLSLFQLYESIFSKSFLKESSLAELQTSHLLLIVANILLATCLGLKKGLEYLGQVHMLCFTFILLLLPLHFLNLYVSRYININSIYLVLLSPVIIGEYIRRMKYAGVLQTQHWITAINTISIVALIIYLVN